MKIEIAEARLYHCGQIARALRPAQSLGARARGADTHRELQARLSASAYARTCWLDGRLAALGGVMGTMAESDGLVWLAIADWATKHPRALLTAARQALIEIGATKNKLSSYIVAEDVASLRFARHLGFNTRPPAFHDHGALTLVERNPRIRQRRVLRKGVAPAPFVIHTAGRSRTAWLAEFLTYGDCVCYNEIAVKFRAMDEVGRFFANPRVGSAETSAAPAWRLIKAVCPGIRSVVVRRPEVDIVSSFLKLYADNGLRCDEDRLVKIVRYELRCMEQIADEPGTLVVDFAALEGMSACRQVFEHCLPYEFDVAWWRNVSARNIQSPVREIVDYYQSNRDEVEGFKRESRAFLRRAVRAGEIAHAKR